LLPTGLSLLVP